MMAPKLLAGHGEIRLNGKEKSISEWLSLEMQDLNKRYVEKLILSKKTSNMIMRLKNAS